MSEETLFPNNPDKKRETVDLQKFDLSEINYNSNPNPKPTNESPTKQGKNY